MLHSFSNQTSIDDNEAAFRKKTSVANKKASLSNLKEKQKLRQQLEDLMRRKKEIIECQEAILTNSNSKSSTSSSDLSETTRVSSDGEISVPIDPIIVQPQKLIWHPNLRQIQVQVTNQGQNRRAIKVKCSDTILFRIYPVFWYLNPGETGILTVTVDNSVVKKGKIILQHTEALPTHLPYLLPQLFKWTPSALLQTVHLESVPQDGAKPIVPQSSKDGATLGKTAADYWEPDSLMYTAGELQWKPDGPRVQTITFTNTTWARRVVKVKCSDNRIYTVSPVFVSLEPAEAVAITFSRNTTVTKEDTFVVQHVKADGPFHVLPPPDVFRAVNPNEIQSITIFSRPI